MKTIKLLSAVVLIAIYAGMVLMHSCSKSEVTRQPVANNENLAMSADDIHFQNKLISFKDKVNYIRENPDYKSGEVMDADSALMYIESLFNATYGFPDERYGKTRTDQTTVLIDLNSSNEVLMDDVVVVFDEIINIVTQYYYQCEFEDKGFILLDISRGIISDNKLEIGLRSVIGEKAGEWDPFGPDDYWWYGKKKGDCDWNVGFGETDAAEKIQYAINNNKPIVSPPPGYIFVYNNYEDIDLFGYEYENENGEKLIFYIENASGNFTVDEQCLDPNEMNFHFYGEKEVIYNILPLEYNKPPNWIFMECDLEGKEESSPIGSCYPTIHHQNKLTYATRHLAAIAVIGPPIEL